METKNELEWVRSQAALFDAAGREFLRVTGPDRASFLHGMVTNEVNKLPPGHATYAALLTNKGAMVGDARLWNLGDDILLDVEPGYGAKVKAGLEKYLISEDAEIHDITSELSLLWLGGPKTPSLFPTVPTLNTFVATQVGGATVKVIGSALIEKHAVELLVPSAQKQEVVDAITTLGFQPIHFDTLEALRIEAGVPRFGQDMDETTIPLEANLIRAIDYNKGCYIGQEVIARATFRGHMNRKLTGLVLNEMPAPRAELRREEKKVGWITSAVKLPDRTDIIALGYVHRDSLEPGTSLEVAGSNDKATVHALPFRPL
ncbi:MAG: CAF17-like 4Fe-4S cluster assembly/insertion protein YgfZ [Myxococcaceae bacterium]